VYYGPFSNGKSGVPLGQVTITKIAKQSASSVKLTWTAPAGTNRCNVFRSESKNGSYTYIASVVGETNYTDTKIEKGKTYYYTVRPYKKHGLTNTYHGIYSASVNVSF
jgi:lactocepin